MEKDLLRLEEVTKYYTSSGGVGLGIHKVNLSFNLGEFVVIAGSSGSGKTTLLNVITGMDTYEEGAIFVNGEDTTYYGASDYENFRRNYVSFIFQNYNLIESYTAFQNVELALIARGIPKKERKEKTTEMLKQVGLEKRMYHRVTKLSGGEKQRVSIARALCSDAPIIACDEITGNLDMETSIEVIELLKKLSSGKLVLLVSHDVNEAIDYATRVVIMHDGSVDKDYPVNQNNDICDECLHEEVRQKLIGYVKTPVDSNIENIIEDKKTKKFGILSLIFGVLGLIPFNIVFSILSLVFGKKSRKTTGKKLGEVGKLLGKIGITITIIVLIVLIILAILLILYLLIQFKDLLPSITSFLNEVSYGM